MSDYKFSCPHCNRHLESPPDLFGQTLDCPSCNRQITVPDPAQHPQAVRVADPPPIQAAQKQPHACPLCGTTKHMNGNRTLYGHPICGKCYSAFANRRQFAYALDVLGFYAFTFVAGMVLAVVMGSSGASQSDIQGVASLLGWMLVPVFLCKDCLSGQSVGKAMCGVKVIDETTGGPGGIGASFKRNLPLVIPIIPLVVAVQLCKGHRIGDGWSNTKVIWQKYAASPVFAPTQTRT